MDSAGTHLLTCCRLGIPLSHDLHKREDGIWRIAPMRRLRFLALATLFDLIGPARRATERQIVRPSWQLRRAQR